MTSLQPWDGHLHGCDGSHRWSGGPADVDGQLAWQLVMRAHLDLHRDWPSDGPRLLAQPVPVTWLLASGGRP
jgi:hypothetical protein